MDIVPQELRAVAKHVIWFESADDALRYPRRFLAYVMTYGSLEDILITKKWFSDDDFRSALINAPAGIFDPASWRYWNLVFDHDPVPPLPTRSILK